MKTLGGRFYRRELAGRLDQLKALAGAIERARSEGMKLDVPVLFRWLDGSGPCRKSQGLKDAYAELNRRRIPTRG